MMKHLSLKYVVLSLALGVALVSQSVASRAQGSLDDRLAAIEKANTGAVDLTAFENSCLELLTTYTKPEEAGKVYAKIAEVFFAKGSKREQIRGMGYCEKAVKYPLDLATASKVYEIWGWTLKWTPVGPHDQSEEEYAKSRPKTVTPWLIGLKLLVDSKVPATNPPMPPIDIVQSGTLIVPRLTKQHEEAVAARKKWDQLMELSLHRRSLEISIVVAYSMPPYAAAELRQIAGDILKDHKDVVDDLVARVEYNNNRIPRPKDGPITRPKAPSWPRPESAK